jgi:branched-chain amino acid transport system permease protein
MSKWNTGGTRVSTLASSRPWQVGKTLLPAATIIGVQLVAFPAPLGIVVRGLTVGLLTALVALGAALVFRANRVVNFAQADLGYPAALVAVMLVTASGLPYLLGFAGGLVAAVVVGAVVEMLIIRRFATASRLILTVATIGLAQLLAALAFAASKWWDRASASQRIDAPWDISVRIDPLTFDANSVSVWIAAPVLLLGVWWLLSRTELGALIRASAERSERAALLGVPVRRLNTLVWALAAGLAFIALWLRAGVLGLPVGSALSLGVLLRSVGALVIGRMTELVTIVSTAMALGVLETAVTFGADTAAQGQAVVAGVILVVLLVRRRSNTRADLDETSSWQQATEPRQVPDVMRRLPEVRITRWVAVVAGVGLSLILPHTLSTAQSIKATTVIAFAIIGMSIVVLTGWAGQVSLGQMAFVAWGGAITAASTGEWQLDPVIALGLASMGGAAVAVVVGLPALRFRGLYLAVTTLAFSLVTTSYFLDRSHFGWVRTARFERQPLLGRVDIGSELAMYHLSLGGLVLVAYILRRVRSTRTGRVMLAMRENELGAQAYGIGPVGVKLVAFAVSGATAAFAGGLLAYQQQAFSPSLHSPNTSIDVFISTVIGGIGSLWGGLLGALYSKGLGWFLPSEFLLLTSSVGVLAVLLMLPNGIGGALVALRDRWLRDVARQRDMLVPSLLADRADRADLPQVQPPGAPSPAAADPEPPVSPQPFQPSQPSQPPEPDPTMGEVVG